MSTSRSGVPRTVLKGLSVEDEEAVHETPRVITARGRTEESVEVQRRDHDLQQLGHGRDGLAADPGAIEHLLKLGGALYQDR